MTTYATPTDVNNLLAGFSLDTTSLPTTTQVQVFLDGCDGELRGALSGAGIDPDTTNARILAALKWYCGNGAAAAVLRARLKDADLAASFQSVYDRGSASIKAGGLSGLLDAPVGEGFLPSSGNIKNHAPAHVFNMTDVLW